MEERLKFALVATRFDQRLLRKAASKAQGNARTAIHTLRNTLLMAKTDNWAAVSGKLVDEVSVDARKLEKELTKNDSSNIFMVYMPIEKNFKILNTIYNDVMKINWTFN